MMDEVSNYTYIGIGIVSIASVLILGFTVFSLAKGIMNESIAQMESTLNESTQGEEYVADSTYDDDMDIVGIVFDEEKGTANLIKQPSRDENTSSIVMNNPNYNIQYEAPANESTGMWVAICFGIVGFVAIFVAILVYKFHKEKDEREHTEYVLDKDLRTIASEEAELLKEKYK